MATSIPSNITGSLDDFLQYSSVGPLQTAIGNNIYGINHRQTPTPVPLNKDHYGLTFFTRPQLNFQTNNLRNLRGFTKYLTTEPLSYQMAVRCMLDPRMQNGYPYSKVGEDDQQDLFRLNCPFVDNRMAFIPLLTNHLKSISGWPDQTTPFTTTPDGSYQEAHSMVDGIITNYSAYDIEATFRNSKGDPVMALFEAWVNYQSAVFEGTLVPYPDFLIENEIDYNTRIYRLILDPTKRKVQKIAATGASTPASLPWGAHFDYSSEKPYNDSTSDISIRFRCNGAQYNDDILIYEFNKTVQIFNPSMNDKALQRDMVIIPIDLLQFFNNRGYPRIDPNTYDLDWWVERSVFDRKVKGLQDFGAPTSVS